MISNTKYSIIQIVKMFSVKYKFISQRAGDRSDSTTLNNNAKKILGFKAKKDIRTYINNFIAAN